MGIKNCKMCGRLFNYLGGQRICPDCKKKLEDKFQEVKSYIRENPKANIDKIAEDNDVDVQQIRQWVREERLQFTADSPVKLQCENCGAPILTGRFCDKCKKQMAENLSDSIKKPERPNPFADQNSTNRMRFLNQ